MSAVVHYAASAETNDRGWLPSREVKRVVIAALGCAVMALSGTGLANYLDTSAATGADASPLGGSQADAATPN